MKIILLGYMGIGKSTIGKRLATKKQLPFIDLDSYIELHEEKNISEIFKDEGEIYFRTKENFYLKELLSKKDNFILSLGGGTPCYADNMNSILSYNNAISVYLNGSIETLKNQLINTKKKRPLIASLSSEKLTEFIAKHLFERRTFYNQATKKINVDNKSIIQIVNDIMNTI